MKTITYAAVATFAAMATLAIGPRASAATTVPFSQYLKKTCNLLSECFVAFPEVAAGIRFEIDHVSCKDRINDASAKIVESEVLVLHTDQIKAYYPMVPVLDGTLASSTYWVIDYPTFALVPATQNAQARVVLDKVVSTQLFQCTISGQKVTL